MHLLWDISYPINLISVCGKLWWRLWIILFFNIHSNLNCDYISVIMLHVNMFVINIPVNSINFNALIRSFAPFQAHREEKREKPRAHLCEVDTKTNINAWTVQIPAMQTSAQLPWILYKVRDNQPWNTFYF